MQYIPVVITIFCMASVYTLDQGSYLILPKGHKENDQITQMHEVMWIHRHYMEHWKKLWSCYYISIFPLLQMQFTKFEISRWGWIFLRLVQGGYFLWVISCFLKNTDYFWGPLDLHILTMNSVASFKTITFWGRGVSLSLSPFPLYPSPWLLYQVKLDSTDVLRVFHLLTR